jgi:hypothetical protein
MNLYMNAVAAERAAKIERDMKDHEAGIEELRADAERYRWLCGMMFRNDTGHLDVGGDIDCNWHDPNKAEIDAAIDAAMKEQK